MQHNEFNGSTATILYKLGRIEVMAETTHHKVTRIEADLQHSMRRLDTLEKTSPLDRLKDASGFVTALAVVILAVAGRYDIIGTLFGR